MKKLIVIPFFFIVLNLFATKHYVSISGTDSGNALTEGTAWATLAYAQLHATSVDDTICLKKGDTFTLTGTLYITHGGTAGHTIVWDGSLWGTGDNAIIQTTTALGLGVINIGTCSYLTLQNITINANNTNTQGVIIGSYYIQNNESYITLQYLNVINIGSTAENYHALWVEPWNTDMSHIIVQHNTINGVAGAGVGFYPARTVMGATPHAITDSYIGYNTITNYSTAGTAECILINNRVTNAIIEYNTTTVGTGTSANGIVIGAGEYGNGEGQAGYYPTNITVRYNDIRTVNYPAVYIQGCQAQTHIWYCNKFYQSETGAVGKNGVIRIDKDYAALTYTGANIKFYNNDIVSSSGASSCFADLSEIASPIIELKNNLMVNTGTGSYLGIFYISVGDASTVRSHNLYYRSGVGNINYYFSTTPYLQYNRADSVSIESYGKYSNPYMTDLAGFDWTLTHRSPAIAAGIGVGINVDYAGNVYAAKPAIGAYEYNSSHPTPTDLATVSTFGATQIRSIDAYCGGGISDVGGGTISAVGVCWSTSINPTIADAHTVDVIITGDQFISNLTGLHGGTAYYVRAYATNESGTAYGGNGGFTTLFYMVVTSGGKVLMSGGKVVVEK